MERIEVDLRTGERTVVVLSPEEEAAALARQAAWEATHTPDALALKAIDGLDRLQFDVLFNHENRIRALEVATDATKTPVSRAQFRDALIARWKALSA